MLIDFLKQNAKKYPNRPALTMQMGFRTVSLTYAQVLLMAEQTALFLKSKGLKPGDVVLVLAPNSPYWIVVYWACLLGGFVVVPLNTQSTAAFVDRVAEQTGAKILFNHLYYRHVVPGVQMFDIDFLPELVGDLNPAEFQEVKTDPEDVIQILYTSGTTGAPKGVMLTDKGISFNVQALGKIFDLNGAKERLLSVLPLSHILEQVAGFLLPYSFGAHIIFSHSPAAIGQLMRKHKITKMITVPEFLNIILSRIEQGAQKKGKAKTLKKLMDWSLKLNNKWFSRNILFAKVHKAFGGNLDTFAVGGAPLDPELEKKWNALGIYVLEGYGLTETSPVIAYNSFDHHRLGSVGRILEGVQVKLGPDNEIWVKGPGVFKGYFKNEEKTKESFSPDGWYKTTDIGEFDDDGYLYLKGRKKYMILGPGGQNVFPEDIEWELNRIPGVIDSCVVGLEKPGGRMEVHASLLLKEDAQNNGQAIVNEANSHLSSYQRITGWSAWPEIDFPRSATRKVKKDEVIKYLKGAKEQEHFESQLVTTPLRRILAHITNVDAHDITEKTTMEKLQIDSLMRIELLARIEQEYRVVVDETKVLPATTVGQLEQMIKDAPAAQPHVPLAKWPRTLWAQFLRIIFQTVGFLLTRIFVKLKVEGLDNLNDLPTPAIFMPNHVSYLDGIVLARALPFRFRRKLAFAAAKDVLYGEFKSISWGAELLFNTFPLPRKEGENIKQGLEYMGELMDQGYSVVLFPEGKMSKDGKLLPFKRGAGLVSVEMHGWVVPVIIVGSDDVVPYAEIVPKKRGTVTVKFGKPIKFSRRDSYEEAMKRIRKEMESL